MERIKRPLLYGARGNMGTRYAAIFNYLGVKYVPADLGTTYDPDEFDGVLIATPTALHVEHIRKFMRRPIPILCEKPITKDLLQLHELVGACEKAGTMLQMVSQYDELVKYGRGPTIYNYFKHGGDGIHWDCMNVLFHARGTVELREDSPIWRCMINGHELAIGDMDGAYITMIRRWLEEPRADLERIWEGHCKAWELEKGCKRPY